MPLTTSVISIALLMDTSIAIEDIQQRIHARAFAAVTDLSKGPAVRQVVSELLAKLDATSPDGVL